MVSWRARDHADPIHVALFGGQYNVVERFDDDGKLPGRHHGAARLDDHPMGSGRRGRVLESRLHRGGWESRLGWIPEHNRQRRKRHQDQHHRRVLDGRHRDQDLARPRAQRWSAYRSHDAPGVGDLERRWQPKAQHHRSHQWIRDALHVCKRPTAAATTTWRFSMARPTSSVRIPRSTPLVRTSFPRLTRSR